MSEINVVSRTQKIIVNSASKSVSVINAGPPAGRFQAFSFVQDTTPVAVETGQNWFKPSTGESFVWSGSVWTRLTFPAAAALVNTGNWAIPAATTVVPRLSSFTSDTSLISVSGSTSLVTVQKTGWYALNFHATVDNNGVSAPGAYVIGNITVNGSSVVEMLSELAGAFTFVSATINTVLNAGQIVRAQMSRTQASTVRAGHLNVTRVA